MITLAKRAQLLKPSPILMLAARAGELKAAGKNVISLSIGEPDWDTYDNIKEAAIKSIRENKTRYTPPAGIPELRKAVAAQVSKDLGVNYDMSQVTVSAGAKFVLFASLQALVNPGDEVILAAPFWASYSTMVELADGVPRIAVCDESVDFKLTPEILKKAITSKTKAILLNSPSNPTGKVYSKDELKGLAEVFRANPQIAIISDDIYNRLSFDSPLAPHILHVAPDLADRVIVLNGASKSYAMTGWRLGWALGPKEIITAMTNYQSQSVSCASATTQYAALEAVLNSEASVTNTVKVLKDRRDFLIHELETIPKVRVAIPEGAFYLWVNISAYMGKSLKGKLLKTSGDLCAALLDDQLVVAVPGDEFGLDGYLRLSYALEKEKGREAVQRMKTFFTSLT
ncbi:MAG: pyridoxal phosphate-dependent aminotransferase [Bdellovibrionota bacterium]